jgi:hypothetical protein
MIANPLMSSLWTASCGDVGHLDYRQQLLTIRGNSRALYLWTERSIAPSFQQKSESFQSTDCDCGQSTDNLGVFRKVAIPSPIYFEVLLGHAWPLCYLRSSQSSFPISNVDSVSFVSQLVKTCFAIEAHTRHQRLIRQISGVDLQINDSCHRDKGLARVSLKSVGEMCRLCATLATPHPASACARTEIASVADNSFVKL